MYLPDQVAFSLACLRLAITCSWAVNRLSTVSQYASMSSAASAPDADTTPPTAWPTAPLPT